MQKEAGSSVLNVKRIREDFPILKREVHGKKLVYLDNAATTQKPKQVIDALVDYYTNYNSNIHRSVHQLAEEATEAFEATRDKVRKFLNSSSREEIVFTKNATEALNIISSCVCSRYVKTGDKIVVTELEHHSNFVPWQQLANRTGARLEIVSVGEDGFLAEEELSTKLKGAKVFSFAQMSNVLGTVNDARRLVRLGHDNGCIVVVDGAQSAPHMKVDLQDMDCDFFAISAHKMLGPTGVGCMCGKKRLLEEIPPFLLGGDMIRQVHRDTTEWNELPWKFEAGTSNIADVIAFGAAIDYLRKIGMERIQSHEKLICKAALEELKKLKGMKIYGPQEPENRGAVIAFNIGAFHAHDVASLLDREGVAVRSGHHCAQVLMEKLGIPATSRASFYLYNDYDDVHSLVGALQKVSEVLS